MPSLRSDLERAIDTISIRTIPFEELQGRRDGRKRRQRLAAAAVAALVVGAVVLGAIVAIRASEGHRTAGRPTVVARIPVGTATNELAVGPDSIWTYDWSTGAVSRIDPATETMAATIPVGEPRSFTSIAIGDGIVWVATETGPATSDLVRIDPETNGIVTRREVPRGTVVTGLGSVWIAGNTESSRSDAYADSGVLVRIDPETLETISTFGIDPEPIDVEFTAGTAWVLNDWDQTIQRIDLATGSVTTALDTFAVGELVPRGSDLWFLRCDFPGEPPEKDLPPCRWGLDEMDTTTGTIRHRDLGIRIATEDTATGFIDHHINLTVIAADRDAVWGMDSDYRAESDDLDHPTIDHGRLIRLDLSTGSVYVFPIGGHAFDGGQTADGDLWILDADGGQVLRIHPAP